MKSLDKRTLLRRLPVQFFHHDSCMMDYDHDHERNAVLHDRTKCTKCTFVTRCVLFM